MHETHVRETERQEVCCDSDITDLAGFAHRAAPCLAVRHLTLAKVGEERFLGNLRYKFLNWVFVAFVDDL